MLTPVGLSLPIYVVFSVTGCLCVCMCLIDRINKQTNKQTIFGSVTVLFENDWTPAPRWLTDWGQMMTADCKKTVTWVSFNHDFDSNVTRNIDFRRDTPLYANSEQCWSIRCIQFPFFVIECENGIYRCLQVITLKGKWRLFFGTASMHVRKCHDTRCWSCYTIPTTVLDSWQSIIRRLAVCQEWKTNNCI